MVPAGRTSQGTKYPGAESGEQEGLDLLVEATQASQERR